MPTTSRQSGSQPRRSSQRLSDFPRAHHLLITAPSHIYAWNTDGIHPIFTSSKAGIVAARARNGVLAVADSQVVVLHDTKHGQDSSWGLTANGDEVRLLENASSGLYLTTKLTNEILRYSTLRSRVQSPIQAHNSAPVAVGCSPSYVVSASDNPPVVYVKNLLHNTSPTLIKPGASDTAVCVVAFHPEKDHIFLLGFRDGTSAAYSADRVSRGGDDGELGHLEEVHRGMTACAFVPGYKARAVSVGSDGRCRLLDLEKGVMLRAWHAKAPLTSVSILKDTIAVGRADGKIHLYSLIGELIGQRTVGTERIINVDWIEGAAPSAIADRPTVNFSDAPSIPASTMPLQRGQADGKYDAAPAPPLSTRAAKASVASGMGLPSVLKPPRDTARMSNRFTIHPDEAEEGTVRRTPVRSPKSSHPKAGGLLDLFSPVKPPESIKLLGSPEKRLSASPPRRSRITSQTFIGSPKPTDPADSHATSTGSEIASQRQTAKAARIRRQSTRITPLKKRRTSFKPTVPQQRRQNDGIQITAPNENAKVLAGLRLMSGAMPQQGSVLGAFAVSKTSDPPQKTAATAQPTPRSKCKLFKQIYSPKHTRDGPAKQKAWHPGNVLERESTWPTDSMQDETEAQLEDDIWLTADDSDKDEEAKQLRRRRLAPLKRPPARQTSRSRVDSKGTYSSIQPAPPKTAPTLSPRAFDGSTEDSGAFNTAFTHFSPTGAFSPASADLRELFPRTSSLSPTRKAVARSAKKSPWAKARASKSMRSPAKQGRLDGAGGGVIVTSPSVRCFEYAKTSARVSELEDEVARLKGEVLALKATLRRNGLSVAAEPAKPLGRRPRPFAR